MFRVLVLFGSFTASSCFSPKRKAEALEELKGYHLR